MDYVFGKISLVWRQSSSFGAVVTVMIGLDGHYSVVAGSYRVGLMNSFTIYHFWRWQLSESLLLVARSPNDRGEHTVLRLPSEIGSVRGPRVVLAELEHFLEHMFKNAVRPSKNDLKDTEHGGNIFAFRHFEGATDGNIGHKDRA